MKRRTTITALPLQALLLAPSVGAAPPPATNPLWAEIDRATATVLPRVIAWRRDIHQHPELGNRETRTAALVAEHLKAIGLEVRTGVAHTGVVGVLRGGKPGRAVALRADMDALPVTEEVDLPFRSTAKAEWDGREVGVMHACGHDNHVAILMGVAEVLAGMRARLPGSVTFLFQPSEEGPPAGETGGAPQMVAEGALRDPAVGAIFGLHVFPYPSGALVARPGAIMAASDNLAIVVRGSQTHGALPWAGVDPIVVASQIVLGLQTIVSRQADLVTGPAVVTIGMIQGGNRRNIIPDEVRMAGTIRTFDPGMRLDIHARVKRTAESIAHSAGASASVTIEQKSSPVYNDPALTERMSPTLGRVAGAGRWNPNGPAITAAEDFSAYPELGKIPGLYFFLGVTPSGSDPKTVAPNHSPRFFADEAALPVGVRALANLAVDYLSAR
jgi:amidohydrolase